MVAEPLSTSLDVAGSELLRLLRQNLLLIAYGIHAAMCAGAGQMIGLFAVSEIPAA